MKRTKPAFHAGQRFGRQESRLDSAGGFAGPLLSSKGSTFRKHDRKCVELYSAGNGKHTTSHAIIGSQLFA
ncbi:MAG: hypothetical protein ACHQK8_03050 [Bacteroidia bacterium]